ncbi:hypothetical protein [Nitratireductor soli]|uniref:hypothetical protein n=1 Tax=Nitratireductor soli TaxID=1670619 RepID=UPI00065DBFD1|nr:hypothetical protein [Nitratireductor soli]
MSLAIARKTPRLAALTGIDRTRQFGAARFIPSDLTKVELAACLMPATSGLSRGWTSRKGECLAL